MVIIANVSFVALVPKCFFREGAKILFLLSRRKRIVIIFNFAQTKVHKFPSRCISSERVDRSLAVSGMVGASGPNRTAQLIGSIKIEPEIEAWKMADILQTTFWKGFWGNGNCFILIQISLKLVSIGTIDIKPALVQVKSRHQIGELITHLTLLPHISVSELGQRWFRWWLVVYSAPSPYLNQCWVIVNWTRRNKLQWNFNQNTNVFIQENASENIVCGMAAILPKGRGRWVKLDNYCNMDCADSSCFVMCWFGMPSIVLTHWGRV